MDFSHLPDPLFSISDEQNAFYFEKIGWEMSEFWTAMEIDQLLAENFTHVSLTRKHAFLKPLLYKNYHCYHDKNLINLLFNI